MTTQYRPAANAVITGATSKSGNPWVNVQDGDRHCWLPLAHFQDGRLAKETLAMAGIVLLGRKWDAVSKAVEGLSDFPISTLIERPGWGEGVFTLADGSIVAAEGTSTLAAVLFEADDGKCRQNGTLVRWMTGIETVIRDQKLITFCLMTAFAAPLLRIVERQGNFGFELSGAKGVGKSTLQQLVASVAGPALCVDKNYWISANTTSNGLEQVLPAHADMPLIIEEMSLFASDEAPQKRAAKLREFVFRLSDGTVKNRYKSGPQTKTRFVYLTSTNEPLSEVLLGNRDAISEATFDRLLTLNLNGRKHGIFDKIPDAFTSSSAAAAHIKDVVAGHYGVAMRRFLSQLVNADRQNPEQLFERVGKYQAEFRKAVNVDLNDGSAVRVADIFGLVYAAGRLAKSYGALPSLVSCKAAAKYCYQNNREHSFSQASPLDRLRQMAADPRAIVVDIDRYATITDADLGAAPAIKRVNAKGKLEILFTDSALCRVFPNGRSVLKDPEVRRYLVADEGRLSIKRKIRADRKADRVYCLHLPVG